jgi:hypothetical protein
MAQINSYANANLPPAVVPMLDTNFLDDVALHLDQCDLFSLSLTCKHYFAWVNDILYSAPRLSSKPTSVSSSNSNASIIPEIKQLCCFARTICARQELANLVKDLRLTINSPVVNGVNSSTKPLDHPTTPNQSNLLPDNVLVLFSEAAQMVGLHSLFLGQKTLTVREDLYALILSRCSNLRALEIEFEVLSFNEAKLVFELVIEQDAPCRAFGEGISALVHSTLTGNQPFQAFNHLEQLEIRSKAPTIALTVNPPFVQDFLRVPSLRSYTSATFIPAAFPASNLKFLDLNGSESLYIQPASFHRTRKGTVRRQPVDSSFLRGCTQLETLKTVASRDSNRSKKIPWDCRIILAPIASTLRHLVLHIPPMAGSARRSSGDLNDLRGNRWLQYVDLSGFPNLAMLELHWSLLGMLTYQPSLPLHPLPHLRELELSGLNPLNMYEGDWTALETEIQTKIQAEHERGTYPSLLIFKTSVELSFEGTIPAAMLTSCSTKAEKLLTGIKKWRGRMPFDFTIRSN